jgi:hypothetical protein
MSISFLVAVTTAHFVPSGHTPVNELQAFLHERRHRFAGPHHVKADKADFRNLARLMGGEISYSGLVRATKAGTLSEENCLRLAEAIGEDPVTVFRVAGKPEIADLLSRLYGKTAPVSTEGRHLIEKYMASTPRIRQVVKILLSEQSEETNTPRFRPQATASDTRKTPHHRQGPLAPRK